MGWWVASSRFNAVWMIHVHVPTYVADCDASTSHVMAGQLPCCCQLLQVDKVTGNVWDALALNLQQQQHSRQHILNHAGELTPWRKLHIMLLREGGAHAMSGMLLVSTCSRPAQQMAV